MRPPGRCHRTHAGGIRLLADPGDDQEALRVGGAPAEEGEPRAHPQPRRHGHLRNRVYPGTGVVTMAKKVEGKTKNAPRLKPAAKLDEIMTGTTVFNAPFPKDLN